MQTSTAPAPILSISPFGRSGSTLFSQLLLGLDDIVSDPEYPHELFVANHLVKTCAVLSSPRNVDVYPKHGPPDNLIGPFPDYERNDRPQNVAIRKGLEAHRECVGQMVATIYRELAQQQGKPPPRYFVEKFGFFLLDDARRLFGQCHAYVLLRDPRDVFQSVLAFNRARGFESFGRAGFADDDEYLRDYFVPRWREFLEWLAPRDDVRIIKYEELVQQTRSTMERVLNDLGLMSVGNVERSLAAVRQNSSHRTSSGRPALAARTGDPRLAEIGDRLGKEIAPYYDLTT